MAFIPVGTTLGTVVQSQLGKSPRSSSQRVEVLFEDEAGHRAWWHGYLHTEKTFQRTMESLEVMGWDAGAHQGDLLSLHGTDVLKGARAEIVVEDASYTNDRGEPVVATRVAWVNGGGVRPDAMPEDEARAFAATLRARILGRKGPRPSTRPGPARQPARAAPAERTPFDDSIPF